VGVRHVISRATTYPKHIYILRGMKYFLYNTILTYKNNNYYFYI
jgi:hypothetical protein